MKTRLVRIGNSHGVRLPKPFIEHAGLTDEVELRLRKDSIVIQRAISPRAGWAEAARKIRERDDDLLLDPPTPTQFDLRDWEW
ncbi:MAG: AbrB/MazE/SpoVT family DNA-binding domain-containing protein [bacterium]